MKRLALLLGIFLASIAVAYSQPNLDDIEIADAIENQYRFDHAINVNKIEVTVVDGIAELTGTVDNIKAKERAAKIAGLVKGVRSVSNRIDVEPSVVISDDGIKDRVEYALLKDPATDSYEVSVMVDDKVVTLKGTVDSYQERELCANVAKTVKGVVDLNNEIAVDYKTDRADNEIQQEIEEALKWNALIDDGLIDVEVNSGKVDLSGTVGSSAEKNNAFFAAWVAGVRSVDNSDLDVKWWAKDEDLRKNKYQDVSDSEIEAAINDAALYDPRVFSFKITPEANNGWVTLRGTVDNLKAKTAAEKLAESTYGVTGVTNRIKVVDTGIQPTDSEIKANINTALWNNTITESWEVDVTVNNGIVTLDGTVDSYLEKMEAEWVASGVEGVNEINNIIDVNYPYSYYWWGYYPYYNLYMAPMDPTDIPTAYYLNDNEIKDNIQSELWWSPFVDRDDVTVYVDNGHVTLEGSVDSWREYHKAAENAWEGGAWSVTNKLIVE